MTCKDCKHWEKFSDFKETYLGRNLDFVEKKNHSVWGLCNKITMPNDSVEKVGVIVFVNDAEDHCADLNTREDFGCILFEK